MLDDIKFNFVPPRYYDANRSRSRVSLDYETACDLDITVVGLDRYTAHPSFRVLMAAYRIDDGPLQHWQAHEGPFPRDLREALLDPSVERWAFNSNFERVVTTRGLKIKTPYENWRCTMVLAYMHSFTGGLADVGEQVGLPRDQQKFKDGKRLIRMFTVPQKISRNQPNEWRNWITDPEDWGRFRRVQQTRCPDRRRYQKPVDLIPGARR
jgi:DNA polymerase